VLFCTGNMEESSNKKTRAATHLQKQALKRLSNAKTHVDIDPQTGRPIGPNRQNFVTYLGVLAQTKVSILEPDWDHVSEVDKNMIWQDICVR